MWGKPRLWYFSLGGSCSLTGSVSQASTLLLYGDPKHWAKQVANVSVSHVVALNLTAGRGDGIQKHLFVQNANSGILSFRSPEVLHLLSGALYSVLD